MIRLMLVDDHAVVRRGLQQLLDSVADLTVVASTSEGGDAAALADEHRPDVVLMDLQMPEVDGVAATREITSRNADVKVVVLTSFSDRERIVAALDAGAVGYMLKDAEPEELIAGIQAAARGESPLHPRAARELLNERSESGSDKTADTPLTGRETEVLALVRQGLANKQIARRLGISERTVKAHLTSLFQRIGVTDRTQAAVWAERHSVE